MSTTESTEYRKKVDVSINVQYVLNQVGYAYKTAEKSIRGYTNKWRNEGIEPSLIDIEMASYHVKYAIKKRNMLLHYIQKAQIPDWKLKHLRFYYLLDNVFLLDSCDTLVEEDKKYFCIK